MIAFICPIVEIEILIFYRINVQLSIFWKWKLQAKGDNTFLHVQSMLFNCIFSKIYLSYQVVMNGFF